MWRSVLFGSMVAIAVTVITLVFLVGVHILWMLLSDIVTSSTDMQVFVAISACIGVTAGVYGFRRLGPKP
jgi:hypothetical protein